MMFEKNISKIVERMKVYLQTERDAAIAEALEMSPSSFAERKRRNSIPYDALVRFCDVKGLSLDWLLTGEGPQEKGAASRMAEELAGEVAEPASTFTVRVDIHKEIAEHNAQILKGLVTRLVRIFEEGDHRKTGAVINLITVLDPKKEED